MEHPLASKPVILGHRGASAHAADNSLEGFALAMRQGADGVELDVRFTADRHIVVHHDPGAPGIGPISGIDFEELRSSRPGIPTLDEAMAVLNGAVVNIEIKNSPLEPDFDPDDEMAAEIVGWIRRHSLHQSVIVSSFNPATVDAVRARDGAVATAQLLFAGIDAAAAAQGVAARGVQWVNPPVGALAGSQATRASSAAHGAGIRVLAWTVNDPVEMKRLAAAGIDGIITDDPALAVTTLRDSA